MSTIEHLSKQPFISVSTDFWTSDNNVSYLTLTGHYVTSELIYKSTVLRFSSFHQRHFSELIGNEIEKQLNELKIFEKVTSITCDGAPKPPPILEAPDILEASPY